jgi:hypothetical protein
MTNQHAFGKASPSRAAGRLARLASTLAVCTVLLAMSASHAAAEPFFGLQASNNYPEKASDMETVAQSGAQYWRLGFDCYRWKENGEKILAAWDSDVRLAWEHNLNILAVVGARCESASGALPNTTERQPGGVWERFLSAVVARYGYGGSFWSGKEHPTALHVWEVWNEPNLGENGVNGVADGVKYGEFLKRSAEVLHAAQGTFFPTTVLFGGMFSCQTSGENGNKSPHDFLKEAASIPGGLNTFLVNGVGLHPYSFATWKTIEKNGKKEEVPVHNELTGVVNNIESVRNDVNAYLSSETGIWVTEVGWGVEPEASPEHFRERVTPQYQAELVGALLNWATQNASRLKLQSLIYYMYRDANFNGRWDSYAGLVKEDDCAQGEYRPAWFAYQAGTGTPFWSPQTATIQADTGSMFTWRNNEGGVNRSLGMAPGTSPSIAGMTRGGMWGRGCTVAFQSNTGQLFTWTPTTGGATTGLGMASGTSPSVSALPSGGFATAFQSSAGALWTYTSKDGGNNRLLGMWPGTSPSIATGPGGNYYVAIQANTGNLFTWSTTESGLNRGFGMAPGTSPSIGILPSGEMLIAFQANTGTLWLWSPKGGGFNTLLGMAKGTSPSLAVLPNGSYAVAIQANTGTLWTWTPSEAGVNRLAGMAPSTSPTIAARPHDAYAIAFQANTGTLWTWAPGEGAVNRLLGMWPKTSPAIESGATPFPSPITE